MKEEKELWRNGLVLWPTAFALISSFLAFALVLRGWLDWVPWMIIACVAGLIVRGLTAIAVSLLGDRSRN
jgi:hypothetical protein